MYAIRYNYAKDGGTLVQIPAAELKKSLFKLDELYPLYTHMSADSARKWVKDGYIHETPLYVDMDGKVRYAKDQS